MLMSSIVRRRDPSWIDVTLGGMMTSPCSHHAHQFPYLTDGSDWLHVWSWCDRFHINLTIYKSMQRKNSSTCSFYAQRADVETLFRLDFTSLY